MAAVGMRLSFWAMVGWVIIIPSLLGLVGIWPTLSAAGSAGLRAQGAAAAIVMPVILASSLVVLCLAQRGPAIVAAGFIAAGVLRAVIVTIAGLLIWHRLNLPWFAFVVWLGLFYLTGLAGECIWLARAMVQDSHMVALGRINR